MQSYAKICEIPLNRENNKIATELVNISISAVLQEFIKASANKDAFFLKKCPFQLQKSMV